MDGWCTLQPVIEVSGLSRLYEGTLAVADVSFQVEAGEVLGLVGPNGAGKTTTLRCLCGIIPPTSGSVRIAGHDLASAPMDAKRELAFVPDEPRLFDYLTVREHLQFFARLRAVPHAAAESERLLEELELSARGDFLPGALSRGMKQKLAVACGLLHRPRALLLDEPLTGLDPPAIRRMKKTIRARADQGAAIVVSSHLLDLVEELSDRILVLAQGKKVAHGTLQELRAHLPAWQGRGDLEEIFMQVTGHGDGQPE